MANYAEQSNTSLQNGRGGGMRFLYIRNGLGLEIWVSLDRAGDISRVSFKGDNMGYFSACGYVPPQYYDNIGTGFLKSFTAGFLQPAVLPPSGSPCEDMGESLPLHGTISNTPSSLDAVLEDENGPYRNAYGKRFGDFPAESLPLKENISFRIPKTA